MTLFGCGPEVVAVELGELCGVTGPVRVLELPADEQIRSPRSLRSGDRVVYVVSKIGEADPDTLFPEVLETTVWSTGPCGENPMRLATGVPWVFTVPAWPEVVLGCQPETGNIISIDPTGKREPHVVFSEVSHWFGCGVGWTPHGLLSVEPHDEQLGALMLHPYPADPHAETAAPITLLDPIRITEGNVSGTRRIGRVLHTFDELVLAVTADDTLVEVDLAGRAVTMLQPEVSAFEASPDARYVMWQDATVTKAVPELPHGEIFLRDRSTDSDTFLAETSLGFGGSPLRHATDGLIALGLGYYNRDPQRLYFLPEFDSAEVPGDLYIGGKLDDGRWLVSPWWSNHHDLVDLRGGGQATRLFPREAEIMRLDSEAAELVEVPQCCIDGDFRDEGPMWRVPLDGSPAEPMARRASRLMRYTADGRILTPVSIDAQWLAPLLLVEPTTQTEQVLDDRVFAHSVEAAWTGEQDIISYSVSDGERSGVYLARLPARDRKATTSRPREVEVQVVDLMPGPDGRPTPRPRPLTDPAYAPPGMN